MLCQQAYNFLPFFFSTLHQTPVLGVGIIIASWFSPVYMGCFLSESDPLELCARLAPLISSCNSCCRIKLFGSILGPSVLSSSIFSYFLCTSVGSVFSASSSSGSVCCQPLGFFWCFLFPFGSLLASGHAY